MAGVRMRKVRGARRMARSRMRKTRGARPTAKVRMREGFLRRIQRQRALPRAMPLPRALPFPPPVRLAASRSLGLAASAVKGGPDGWPDGTDDGGGRDAAFHTAGDGAIGGGAADAEGGGGWVGGVGWGLISSGTRS